MGLFDKGRREEKRPGAGDVVDFDGVTATYQEAIRFISNSVRGNTEKLLGKDGGIAILVASSIELGGMVDAIAFIYGKDRNEVRRDLVSIEPEGWY